jgi:hypothetical protein
MPYGVPATPLVGGNSAVEQVLQGYVFQSGIHKPEHSNILTYKYPQYYATALLDRLGASEGVEQDVFSWNVIDRTREGGDVDNLEATGSTTVDFETGFDWTSDQPGYLLVGDVIRLESGALGEVTAVGDAGTLVTGGTAGKQGVTVRKVGGGNWGASDIADTMVFGHSHNMFGEGSSAPEHRLYLPTEEYNSLTILRRSLKITRSEFTNRTYIGDGSAWYFTQEDLEMKEFAKDREMAIMFGKLEATNTDTPTKKSSKGIWDYVSSNGVYNEFASASGVSEEDIQDHIKELMIEGASNEITVLAGADFMVDFQRAMKPYLLNGGVSYGSLGNQMVGLDVTRYYFLGKTIHLAYYELFEDTAILPFVGTPTTGNTGKVNFSNTSLWLDLGTDSSGKKLLSLKHKEKDGISAKFIHGIEPGMVSPNGVGGIVTSGFDGFRIHYLSEIGTEFRLANRSGILRSGS